MSGVWVRLKVSKHVEELGKTVTRRPGDWVQVGKQTALAWEAAAEAEIGPNQMQGKPRRSDYEPHEAAFTLFAVPMAFRGEIKVKQENALGAWVRLDPRPEIMLFGDEGGIADAAEAFGCLHLPRIRRNEFGTPLVGDAFAQMGRLASPGEVVCYVNSDVILLQDWADALVAVAGHFERFLMVGQRWDVNVRHPLAFGSGWEAELRRLVAARGECHGVGAVDYFAYRPSSFDGLRMYDDVPDFAIGRSAWDNWLVGHGLAAEGVAVVDASEAATVVHQDKRAVGVVEPNVMTPARLTERERNRALYDADRERHGFTGKVSEAPWEVTAGGEIVERLNNTKSPRHEGTKAQRHKREKGRDRFYDTGVPGVQD